MKSRRWDSRPETAKDKRFFDLRESGYTGAIDQDGNPVADVDTWASEVLHGPRSGGEDQ